MRDWQNVAAYDMYEIAHVFGQSRKPATLNMLLCGSGDSKRIEFLFLPYLMDAFLYTVWADMLEKATVFNHKGVGIAGFERQGWLRFICAESSRLSSCIV